ncbi:CAAD domain-containing protein [Chroococcidiopsis sp. FACHB-1243]|uniref:CAAD domain-containing protein n=1 Tax=Chroococcidiopsis sp. [FACHB-1243] TaxID=2692781 RepID=UPI00177B662E|nr:CAAD domain-containing protein [Chroococcidiopsis sp. [FACHB-1243]]MBD2308993.1 CAAD domain-containing protein [Chroococcidiopsis sp. [FACHB-1243]]
MQQTEYINANPEVRETSESLALTTQSTAKQLKVQGQQIGNNITVFFTELPENISRFFQKYKQPITNILLVLAAFIALRVLFAVLAAFNSIPLLAPTFQLIGIFYSVWFINRYLLRKPNREELIEKLQSLTR